MGSTATPVLMLKRHRLMISVQFHIKFVLFFKSKVRPTGEKKFVLLYRLLVEIRLLDPQIFLLVNYVARVEFPVLAFQSGRGSSFLLGQDLGVFSSAETVRMPLSLWHLSLPRSICCCFAYARAFSELN